jgi:type III restriction enzyme
MPLLTTRVIGTRGTPRCQPNLGQTQAWVRLDATVPLKIPYAIEGITQHYLPDFIVFDDAGVLWIVEGKADSQLTDPVVVAKRDAAREWVNTVNAAPEVHDRWGYVLAGERVTAAAGTWAELRAASQSYGPG